MPNPLIDDRNIEFLLYEHADVESLCRLEHFAEHSRETFALYLASARKLGREVLFPSYRQLDEEPPRLVDGRVVVHPRVKELYRRLVQLDVIAATRPFDVGGQQMPLAVNGLATAYLMAGNLTIYGYLGLTAGAARLIESFGSEDLRKRFMAPMYEGRFGGTMALTEPQAGSSLTDVRTRATVIDEAAGEYAIRGNKIFISAGDHDVTENIVHLTLARIEGAPAGIKGVSLFAVPRLRMHDGGWIDNDVATAGLIHKIGWKALPSIALNLGDAGDCRGYLVGEPHEGIRYMFQMMNEARLMVGMNAASTASVAYLESREYARERPQGRALGQRDPASPQVPIIAHADVRRMLLRQKAIVEGSFALLTTCGMLSDAAEYGNERADAALLLDMLTPIAKSFPAEKGFESNALAVQIHGGYGYSSEYLPESWLRDQKLNTIHEGTTGIQSLDLLGRKVMAKGGHALALLRRQIDTTLERARAASVDEGWCASLDAAAAALTETTQHLASLGLAGDVAAMLLHSFHYLELASTVVIGWQWIEMAAAAREGLVREGVSESDHAFYSGKLCAAQYWVATELTRVRHLAQVCTDGDDAYQRVQPDWL